MRLWTVHPMYLDTRGLVALWREGLLAQRVLSGATRGYRRHPQLERFRAHEKPLVAVATYLRAVHAEAQRRGYSFDASKIASMATASLIPATRGQLLYEWQHLMKKLRARSPDQFERLRGIEEPEPHPLFRIIPGPVAPWERVHSTSSDEA